MVQVIRAGKNHRNGYKLKLLANKSQRGENIVEEEKKLKEDREVGA